MLNRALFVLLVVCIILHSSKRAADLIMIGKISYLIIV